MPPTNPLLQSIRSAVDMNEKLSTMFTRAGSISENKGYIVRAYRNANRALSTALQETNRQSAVREVVQELRVSVNTGLRDSLQASVEAGVEESARQLRFYGIETEPEYSMGLSEQVDTAINAVMAQLDAQDATIQALLLSDIDDTLITGDDSRQGVLKPGDILPAASYWIAALLWDSFSWWSKYNGRNLSFQKQVVAALDGRTTDCCLRAHGQIVPLDGQFHLTGTPRFSDRLSWTPFHWSCRSAVTLYLPDFDDGFTQKMIDGAKYVLAQRKLGKNPDQHPADAFWN